jgi:predicted aldo/keto reductase-like oxidoreductase
LSKGGNFIDSANNYQFQETEKWVGEWMAKRGNRDEMGLSLPQHSFDDMILIFFQSLRPSTPPTFELALVVPTSW